MLDNRLKTIKEMAGSGGGAIDVGCDHGLLICSMVESGSAAFGIACDINSLPLAKAQAEITRRGLEKKITTVLTDGLQGIDRQNVDRIIIAGMGGELILKIMDEWQYSHDRDITFLLQPMTKTEALRLGLWQRGYTISEEKCCFAAGKAYCVIKAIFTGTKYMPQSPAEPFLGKIDFKADPKAAVYRVRLLKKLHSQLEGLNAAQPTAEVTGQLATLQKIISAVEAAGK